MANYWDSFTYNSDDVSYPVADQISRDVAAMKRSVAMEYRWHTVTDLIAFAAEGLYSWPCFLLRLIDGQIVSYRGFNDHRYDDCIVEPPVQYPTVFKSVRYVFDNLAK